MTYSELWMSIVSGVSMGGIFIYLLLNHTSSETYNININHCCAKENCLVETVYDEEDEEEEGLEEFEYKGKTYYRDAEGNVYSLYEDGELNDTPVGRWNSAKGTIRFVAT